MWPWQESEIRGLTGLSAGCAAKTAAGESPPAPRVSGKRFREPLAVPFNEGLLTR